MEWLNYHHLLYFWSVAKHGTVAKASEDLRLTQPTISTQIRALEDRLGEKLFSRSGKYLVLTEMGHVNDHLKFSPVRSREIPPSW